MFQEKRKRTKLKKNLHEGGGRQFIVFISNLLVWGGGEWGGKVVIDKNDRVF